MPNFQNFGPIFEIKSNLSNEHASPGSGYRVNVDPHVQSLLSRCRSHATPDCYNYSAKEVMFRRCLFVCLFVSGITEKKTTQSITTKIGEKALDVADKPDHVTL